MALGTEAGQQCWKEFVTDFNLQDMYSQVFDPLALYADKTIYFTPDCTPHVPTGLSGGANFGILAKIPVLVNPYTLVK